MWRVLVPLLRFAFDCWLALAMFALISSLLCGLSGIATLRHNQWLMSFHRYHALAIQALTKPLNLMQSSFGEVVRRGVPWLNEHDAKTCGLSQACKASPCEDHHRRPLMNKVRDSLLSLIVLPGFLPCTAVQRLQVKTQMDHEQFHHTLWSNQRGQDIAEYAVILAVILVLVVGTIRLVGSNANNAFSSVASSIQ